MQRLFGNKAISKHGRSLFFVSWLQSNIVHISDIWDLDESNWKKGGTIYNMLKDKRNWIVEYTKIKQFIPCKWKQVLKENVHIAENDNTIVQSRKIQISHSEITVQGKPVPTKKIRQKDLYYLCLYPVTPPTCVVKWCENFQLNLTIDEIFHERRHFTYIKQKKF